MAADADLRRGFEFGPYTVIPERGIVRREGAEVHLEPKQMDALVTLARHQPGVVSKDLLVPKEHRVSRGLVALLVLLVHKGCKANKDSKGLKVKLVHKVQLAPKEPKVIQVKQGLKENKALRDSEALKDSKESKESKENRDSKEFKENKDLREHKEFKGHKDSLGLLVLLAGLDCLEVSVSQDPEVRQEPLDSLVYL